MCTLRVSSQTDKFVKFLAETSLPAQRVSSKRRQTGRGSFSCGVSEAEWNDLAQQITDAIRFLEVFGDEIKRLRNLTPDVQLRLDFPVSSLISEKRHTQTCAFPKALLERLVPLGVELDLTLYPPTDDYP